MNEFELIFAILENMHVRLNELGEGGQYWQEKDSHECRALLERLRAVIPTQERIDARPHGHE